MYQCHFLINSHTTHTYYSATIKTLKYNIFITGQSINVNENVNIYVNVNVNVFIIQPLGVLRIS